jgi:catechol 2,3-dioxygenase-like lactoylglutathione lyase family enzyme
MSSWEKKIAAITCFVEDLPRSMAFYEMAFDIQPLQVDHSGATFRIGDTYVRLTKSSEAPSAIAPAAVGKPGEGPRHIFGMFVDDVDAVAAELQGKGIVLLNGPEDRPWGMRTACFQDPDGNVWSVGTDTD